MSNRDYTPRPLPLLTDAERVRFWALVPSQREGECWEWNGLTSQYGYGMFRCGRALYTRGKKGYYGTHRLSYSLAHGVDPRDLYVLHKCDNRRCVNPAHLFLGTKGDNARDCAAKDRKNASRGERHFAAKLTLPAVLDILRRGLPRHSTQQELANEYGVSAPTIAAILVGRVWRRDVMALPDAARADFCDLYLNPAKTGLGRCGARLTEEDVVRMRRRYADGGISQRALGAEFSMDQGAVSKIILGKSWKHLPIYSKETPCSTGGTPTTQTTHPQSSC